MIDTKRKTIITTVGGLTTELINTHSQPWSVRMEERDGLRCGSVDWWLAHPLGTPSFGFDPRTRHAMLGVTTWLSTSDML